MTDLQNKKCNNIIHKTPKLSGVHRKSMSPIQSRLLKNKSALQRNKISEWLSKEKALLMFSEQKILKEDGNLNTEVDSSNKEFTKHKEESDKSILKYIPANNSSVDETKENRLQLKDEKKHNKKNIMKSKYDTKHKSNKSKTSSNISNSPILNCKRKPKTLDRNDSFEEYFEEILRETKRMNEYKKRIEAINDIEKTVDLNITFKSFEETGQMEDSVSLDCKHLSLKQLTKAFNKNKQYLADIISGKQYSERHITFNRPDYTSHDLVYNTSTVVFSQEQIEHIMTLMEENFGSRMTEYFFKVLLPECCLKFFMDEHSMNSAEALMYLDTRPLD